MQVVITVYKDTGKFYMDATVYVPGYVHLHNTEAIAKIVKQHVPLLTNGFVHVRLTDEEAAKPGAPFFNHLFAASLLK